MIFLVFALTFLSHHLRFAQISLPQYYDLLGLLKFLCLIIVFFLVFAQTSLSHYDLLGLLRLLCLIIIISQVCSDFSVSIL